MNNLIKLLLIFTISLSLQAENKFESRFGFLSEGTLLSSFKDARVALKVWLEDVAVRYEGKLNIEFYDNSDSLYNALKNNELDMVVLDLPFFFKNKKDILETCDNFWALNMLDDKYSQYYLIAKKSLNAKNFKDIKGKTISLKKGNIGASVWLDKNSLISNKKSSKKITKRILEKKKESTAILNVFFNKSDFAIVRKKTWDIISELNPTISKKLEIVQKSEKIHIPFIGLFRKDINKLSIESFFKLSKDLNEIKGSQHIIALLKFNSLFRVNDDYLKNLDKYYNEYFMLQKKYK
ncbi:PhnD/SsuA/transferrin family substrate-binding protein [Poseidonibacter antarcticus]|uniref:PhnD/SsuA/transferrin family substrate-binding protein n=1 Tax=Poseidonibacter antarcticus TaxID=2478538 RepID=UPI000EF5517F|nr:PhnD/SsuA/transferrin family substrate-binding protein [Poseidonibacter antarcticus]